MIQSKNEWNPLWNKSVLDNFVCYVCWHVIYLSQQNYHILYKVFHCLDLIIKILDFL